MAETKRSMVARLFAEHGGALQAFLYRRVRRRPDVNRYSRLPIEITTPALRSLEISGAFSTDDTRGFIAFLRSLDGVRVEVTPTRILVSQQ